MEIFKFTGEQRKLFDDILKQLYLKEMGSFPIFEGRMFVHLDKTFGIVFLTAHNKNWFVVSKNFF